MIPPESRDSTAARPEHPNADATEENGLKNNSMKMIEALKEDIETPLNKWKKKQTKKMKEVNKFLKENK
ncbi:hypothetical protein ACQP3J_33010, partial [Escherichia coli]